MNRFLENQVQGDCCGCSACVEICPKGCLTIGKNGDGFIVPIISNKDACIECDLCSKVCPVENKFQTNYHNKYYGAYNDTPCDIDNSSSGGIFPILARWVIEKGGVVYGAFLDDEHDLYHIRIIDTRDIKKLQSSKYFQSEIRDTYKTCKADLQEGRLVLFTGTPCQVQGLKFYLRKDYENLFTADVICHGVPSKIMFDAYVSFLEKKHRGKLVDINFRDKKRNGWSITLRYTMEFANGKRKDYYLIRDITMGDFWGYQKKRPDLRHDSGLSLIIVNSTKGARIFNALKSLGVCFNEVDEACVEASENKNLYYPTRRPEIRDVVYEELEKYGFEYITQRYFRKSHTWKNKLKNYLPPVVVNKLKNRK